MLLLLLAGCQSQHLDVAAIAPLADGVLVIDRGGLVRVVRIDGASTSSTDVVLGDGEASLLARPGSPGEELVLTMGRLGDSMHAPVPSEIVRLDRTGELGPWSLHGQYQRASPSRDGRYVVALAPSGRLVVENRVEVVDLSIAESATNPLSLSLRSLGGETPAAAELSTPLPWPTGGTLRVAALFASGQLSLYDLDAPSDPPLTIPTTTDTTAVGPVPVEGFFVGSELVVRASAGSQLLVVALVPGTGTRRFDVAVRTLEAAAPLRALAIDGRAMGPRVLALTAASLEVFDLDTGMSTPVALHADYDTILLFDGVAPGDATSRARVALYGAGSWSITFVDLGMRASEVLGSFALPLSFPPDAFVADASAGRLVVFQDLGRGTLDLDVAASYGRRPISVVSLIDRSALALVASDELSRAVVSSGLADMWVAGTNGYVARFDLMTEDQEEHWLDRAADTLLPLLGSTQRVLAFSSVRTGSFAILEPHVPVRTASNLW
jgi:hypothetical protein